jgi:hypothetical protein
MQIEKDDNISLKGQSLMDILVGTAIGVILIFAAVEAIAPALKSGTQAANTQTASWLATGLLDNVKAWSDGNWHNTLSVATGTTHQYFLITSSSPYTATTGIESIVVSTTTYFRYFYATDVYRDNSTGNIVTSGGSYDPSTKQITVVYGWQGSPSSTVSEYLTRNQQNVYNQTDWTGGASTTGGVVSSVNFQFASSTNVNFTSSPGSIIVTGH